MSEGNVAKEDNEDRRGSGVTAKKLLNGGVDPNVGKKTQFKKAQSGNPSGPKPGYKHINTWIQEIVTDPCFEATIIDPKMGFVDYKGAPIVAILKSLAHIALTHPDHEVRLKAMDKIFKYGWPTKNEVTGVDGGPIEMNPYSALTVAELRSLAKGK